MRKMDGVKSRPAGGGREDRISGPDPPKPRVRNENASVQIELEMRKDFAIAWPDGKLISNERYGLELSDGSRNPIW